MNVWWCGAMLQISRDTKYESKNWVNVEMETAWIIVKEIMSKVLHQLLLQ